MSEEKKKSKYEDDPADIFDAAMIKPFHLKELADSLAKIRKNLEKEEKEKEEKK
ncbi:MAG: hypothetical protein INQ03_17830 [Candidatus Heimdallarchaeota archaeon]|nr:hypothetical protein [Candidatus Heimdallarchaeota archaeon]